MEKLWKKLEAQMIQSYESMVRDDGDVTAWNQAFDTLMKIVESGRREKHNFAPELFCLNGMEGFSFDLKIWINDYLETLEQEEDQAQMEKVCRKLLDRFCVERGSSGGSEISSGFIDAVPGQKRRGR